MIRADAIKMIGTGSVQPWGFAVSIGGLSTCCAVNATIVGVGCYKIVRLADLSAVPTLAIDGTPFDATNGAVWLPNVQSGCAGRYLLQDPYVQFGTNAAGGTSAALCEIDTWVFGVTNCSGTALNKSYGIIGVVETFWQGTQQCVSLDLSTANYSAPFSGALVPIFHGSAAASCLFNSARASITMTNQLTCGQALAPNPTVAGGGGGTASLTPITVSNRVAWACPNPTGSATGAVYLNGAWTKIKALPCYGQCFG